MLLSRWICRVFPIVVAAAVAGCSSNSSTGTGGGGGSGATTSTASGASICSDDPRGEPYKPGMTEKATDGALTIRLLGANPAPPTRGNNTFTLEVTDASGKAIEGASIATKTYMPDHGHGSSVIPTTHAGSKPGQYVIDPLNLFMPGIWQVTFDVTPKKGAADSVMFTFCIDG